MTELNNRFVFSGSGLLLLMLLLWADREVDAPPLIARCFSRTPTAFTGAISGGEDGEDVGSAADEDVEDAVDDVMEDDVPPVSLSDSERRRPAVGAAIAFCPVFKELKCLAGGTFAKAL